MRKVLAMMLALILALSVLAGCTNGGGSDKTQEAQGDNGGAEDSGSAVEKAIAGYKSGNMPTVTLCFGNFAGR